MGIFQRALVNFLIGATLVTSLKLVVEGEVSQGNAYLLLILSGVAAISEIFRAFREGW